MNPKLDPKIPIGSDDYRKRNPHIFGGGPPVTATDVMEVRPLPPSVTAVTVLAKVEKRIRQDEKPLLNKLESAFLEVLKRELPEDVTIHAQSWRVRIANGAWFKVDFCAFVGGKWHGWEVKGNKGKNIDRGKLALKVAASSYPEIDWFIVWRRDGQWHRQQVLP